MIDDSVVLFSGKMFRIDMNIDIRKIRQGMHQLMPGFHGNRVPFGDRKFGTHTEVDFRMQAMARPTQPYIGHVAHTWRVVDCMGNFIGDCGIDAVQQAGKGGPFPDCQTIGSMATVMTRPMIGSVNG